MRSKFFYTNIIFILASITLIIVKPNYLISQLWLMLFVYSLILAGGCTFIAWDFFLKSKNVLLKNSTRQIALTFDDGPQPNSSIILNILQKHGVKASFFLIGDNVNQYPQLARQMLEQGHVIGNHSMHHGHWVNLKLTQATVTEIEDCSNAIESHTGFKPTLYRPPHGVVTHHLAWALQLTGLKCVGWSIRSFDTASKDENTLLSRLKSQLHDGAIILLHDFCPNTAAVLPRFIDYAQSQGYEFVTV